MLYRQSKGPEAKLTPLPKPAAPRGLPGGTLGHTAVETHVRLLQGRVENWQTGDGARKGEGS